MASGVRGTFGHHLTVPAAFVAYVIMFAIAWGLLVQQRWARALHLMQPVWIEALVFLAHGGIPGRDTLLFDAAAGAVWLAAYWWWLYRDQESRDWFA